MNTQPIADILDSEARVKILRVQAEQMHKMYQFGRDLAEKDAEQSKVRIAENALHHVEIKDLF